MAENITKMAMSDAERHNLAEKLDKELDAFMDEKMSQPRKEVPEDNRTIDEIVEDMKQHPAFMTEFDPSKPLSPEMEGMQQLIYESNDAKHNADGYREDGNDNFKRKKYRWAIDNYTQGIRQLCADREMNAVLYCNRAASHFRLQNYRSSLRDATISLKFKPTHMKAVIRACLSCMEVKKYSEGISWCEEGLSLDNEHKQLLELRPKLDKLLREQEKEKRKELLAERKNLTEEDSLLKVIRSRGVKLHGLKYLETHNPTNAVVHLDENDILQWPVLFLYPEYGESDSIEAFSETTSLNDHINVMFDPSSHAPWDEEKKYKPEDIEVYFEDKVNEKLIRLKKTSMLKDILQHDKYTVYGGTPGFILLVKNSGFAKNFLAQYEK